MPLLLMLKIDIQRTVRSFQRIELITR